MEFFKSSKGRFLATIIMAVGVLFLLLYFAIWKLFIEIRNSSYAVSSGRASLIFLDKELALAGENQKSIQGIASEVERMKKASFDKERPLEFIEALENAARLSGSVIEITPVEGKDSLSTFLISADGDFPSLFKFLKLIEVMQYQVVVEEANFEKLSSNIPSFSPAVQLKIDAEEKSISEKSVKSPQSFPGVGRMKLNLTLKTGLARD